MELTTWNIEIPSNALWMETEKNMYIPTDKLTVHLSVYLLWQLARWLFLIFE